MNNWDERWLQMAKLVATWSKSRTRTTSAVIVDDRNVLVSIGWNGFPRGIDDDVDSRHERPAKMAWTEHAERNAIYNAAANGIRLRGCKMYMPWYPCADCARAILQTGIAELICVEPVWNDEKWGSDFKVVREMFEEVGLLVRFLDGVKPPEVVR